jgi:hypothetical protein
MGSYSLLQIVGSTIIGGLFILMLFRFNTVMVEKRHRYKTKDIIQSNLTEVSKLISLDLNKIGYCNDKVRAEVIFKDPIVEASDTVFSFLTDVPVDTTNPFGDGIDDVLTYSVGPKIASTSNPEDKILYREVDGGVGVNTLELNYGITDLRFRYYDASGSMLPTPVLGANLKSIKVVEFTVTVQDIYGYNYTYMADSTDTKIGDTFYMTISKTKVIGIKNIKGR